MINKKSLKFINYYYLIVVIVYLAAIYFPFIRVGLLMSFIISLGIIILIKNKKYVLRKGLDVLVFAFIMYNAFSFVFFSFSELPISVFFKEFSNSILPIFLFYFFGKINKNTNVFYKVTLYSLIGCFIIGFYFQYTVPTNYAIFMKKLDGIGGTDPVFFATNYRSFLGLTATGSLSAIGVLLSFNVLHKSNFKKGKIAFAICFIALILTFRRAALYTGLFAVLWVNFLLLFKFKGSKFKLLFFEFLFIFVFLYYVVSSNPDFFNDLLERFSSLSNAIDERSDSWYKGLSNTQNIIFGDGLGRYGHKAVEYSNIYIPDGNYFRMIAELGIFGFILFAMIIFSSIYQGVSKIRKNYISIGIIIMISLQAVGSDVISFQLIAPVFWYSIGSCSRPQSFE